MPQRVRLRVYTPTEDMDGSTVINSVGTRIDNVEISHQSIKVTKTFTWIPPDNKIIATASRVVEDL